MTLEGSFLLNQVSGEDVQHGPIRKVTNAGDVYEYTTLNGVQHGLYKHIGSYYITVELFVLGDVVASLTFNQQFEELITSAGRNYGRTDPDGFFDDLFPSDFML